MPRSFTPHTAVAALVLLGVSGCGGDDIEGSPILRLPEPAVYRLAPAVWQVTTDAYFVPGELATLEPLGSRRGDRIEFLPAVYKPAGDAARFELSATPAGGGRERVLWSGPPHYIDPTFDEEGGERVLDPLDAMVEVELPAGAHTLRWRLRDAPEEVAGQLLMPRVVRAESKRRPSILMVCSDTHRFDHSLSPRGRELMPRLNELCEESAVYTRAYSAASWTLPSITTTLSGLFPRNHLTGLRVEAEEGKEAELPAGVFGFGDGARRVMLNGYPGEIPTLFERLRGAGYRTASVIANPLYTTSGLSRPGADVLWEPGVVPGEEVDHAARSLIERLPGDGPVALLVHYMDVHHFFPWHSEDKTLSRPEAYERAVRESDRYLASLLDAWNARFGPDESLIVFYSDHGELLGGDEGRAGHGASVDDLLMHVPLVIRYPRGGDYPVGEQDEFVGLVDLVPTLLDAADVSPGRGRLDGRSLLGGDLPEARLLFSDYQLYGDEISTARDGGNKLTINWTRDEREHAGPGPQAELERAYGEYLDESNARTADLSSDIKSDPDEVRRMMTALGYFSGDEP